jgi:hypothetical protein
MRRWQAWCRIRDRSDAAGGEFFFQFQRVEGVPCAAVDVFADDGGECRGRAGGFGEQVGHAAVAGDADPVDFAPALGLAAVFQVQAAGFDVPVPGHDPEAGRQPGLRGAGLTVQGGAGVLQFQGGGPA